MGVLADLKRELIAANMAGAAGSGNIDWADLANDSLEDIPLSLLLQQDYSLPRGALAQCSSRFTSGSANNALLVTQRATLVAIPLIKGMVVSSISVHSGATAAGAPTFQKFGLYDSGYNRLALTADDGATAWAAESLKTLALTDTYTVLATDIYYVAILVAAGTLPTLRGVGSNNYSGLPPATTLKLHRPVSFTTAINLTDLPNPIGALSNAGSAFPYVFVS